MELDRNMVDEMDGAVGMGRAELMAYFMENTISSAALGKILIASIASREPDFVVGEPDAPYMERWWIKREDDVSIYLHKISRDDDDRALHDHPWDSVSVMLSGLMREVMPNSTRLIKPGQVVSRKATDAHRLEVVVGPVWTLFLGGKRVREWGFHCPNGWRPWHEFVNASNKGLVGNGCH